MGQIISKARPNKSNYDCHICKKNGKVPNILGRYIVIENNKLKCTGCNYVFTREELGNICDQKVFYAGK